VRFEPYLSLFTRLIQHSIPAHPKTLSFDHIYPPFGEAVRPSYAAVLYGNLESPNFRALHSYLLSIASSPERRVSYIFRPAPPATRDDTDRSYLSGYGVALDLKKMEYLAVDDRHSASSATQDTNEHKEETTVSSDPIVTLLDTYPVNETLDASTPLTQEELSCTGSLLI
jgi:UDP-glucose:glycoprotein glucosyltransferase